MDDRDIPERNATIELLLFALIAVCMLADLASDAAGDANSTMHVILEGSIMLLAGAGVLRLWGTVLAEREHAKALRSTLAAARADAERWAVEARDALAGMGTAIERQFTSWGLTPAEQAVGLMLLSGQSHKEVAAARQTSERTVRQQALAVYRKAGVRSRSELSGFFLGSLGNRPGTDR